MAAAETDVNVALPDLASPARPPEPSWDSVAGKLLRERFLLTALELYLELEERGRDLPVLKEYFSNPVHFEAKTAAETHPQGGPGMCEYWGAAGWGVGCHGGLSKAGGGWGRAWG